MEKIAACVAPQVARLALSQPPRPERGLSSPQQLTDERGLRLFEAARLSNNAAGWKARAPAWVPRVPLSNGLRATDLLDSYVR